MNAGFFHAPHITSVLVILFFSVIVAAGDFLYRRGGYLALRRGFHGGPLVLSGRLLRSKSNTSTVAEPVDPPAAPKTLADVERPNLLAYPVRRATPMLPLAASVPMLKPRPKWPANPRPVDVLFCGWNDK